MEAIQLVTNNKIVDELFENSFVCNGKDLEEILDHLMTKLYFNCFIRQKL